MNIKGQVWGRKKQKSEAHQNQSFLFPLLTSQAGAVAPWHQWSWEGRFLFSRGSGPDPTLSPSVPGGRWYHPVRRSARLPPHPHSRIMPRNVGRWQEHLVPCAVAAVQAGWTEEKKNRKQASMVLWSGKEEILAGKEKSEHCNSFPPNSISIPLCRFKPLVLKDSISWVENSVPCCRTEAPTESLGAVERSLVATVLVGSELVLQWAVCG